MSAKVKGIIISTALLLCLGLYVGLRYWHKPPPPFVNLPPGVQLAESKLIGRKDGERQWEIITKSVLQAGDVVTITDLEKITIFQAQGADLNIRTEKAVWQRKNEVLRLEGAVTVEGADEFTLQSDLLIWDGGSSTLTSPGPVVIRWGGLNIQAGQMVWESESGLVYLEENLKIQDGRMQWKAKRAVYDSNREALDFYGSVVLETKAGAEDEKD